MSFKMNDELVFPTNDALSMIGDLTSNMMNEDVLAHDINPAFPQTEGSINIPEIIPPIISPKGATSAFKQTSDQTYTPITQLMKQTEELAATLDGPLNSNINDQMNFNHMQGNSSVVQEPILGQHMTNPLVNNNINFVNPNSHVPPIPPIQNTQNTQCLVIGGQRIPISTQNQHSSSVINIKHAANTTSPLIPTCAPHAMHASSSINANNSMKQTMMVKAPPLSQNTNSQNPNKPPMKGQIVKTPDQRLMFVTEVNGRRVGYLIQQPKQANIPQTPASQVQTPTPNVLNQHFDNRNNQEDSAMNNDNIETSNIDKHKCTTSEPINFTLDENKDIIMTHSENITKVTEPLIKTDMKSLREKLMNLRNPLNAKNSLNLKSSLTFPTMSKPEEKIVPDNTIDVDKPDSPTTSLPSPTLHSPSPLPSPQTINDNDKMAVDDTAEGEVSSPVKDVDFNDIHEEEEGQEIEFSENDLTAEFDEENHPEEDCSPGFEVGEDGIENEELNHEVRSRTMSTDDEDCMPLSMLRENSESPVPPVETVEVDTISKPKKGKGKKGKQQKEPNNDTSVKKDEDENGDEKSKKKGKSKVKKKKDSRKPKRPMIAYRLFFRDTQKEVRLANPQMNFGEISKEVSKLWEALDEPEKKKYHDIHEAAKLEYEEKLKTYKELIAQEKDAGISNLDSPLQDDPPDDDVILPEEIKDDKTQKKKGKRGKKRKLIKSPETKGEFTFEDGTKEDLDSSIEMKEDNGETNQSKGPGKKIIVRKPVKSNDKPDLDNPPSSPSLPSSASSDEEEEDSESAISRIREKAAELHKYLKQQRFVVTQKKSKPSGKKSRSKTQAAEGDTDELKKEEDDVPDDTVDKAETEETTPMDHKIKIRVKEEGPNVIVNEDVEEKDICELEYDEEATDTADEVKDVAMEEDVPSAIKEEPIDEEEDVNDDDYDENDDENDEPSDDEKVNHSRRKKSSRIKKLEETASRENDKTAPRLRKRKSVKKAIVEDPRTESDEEIVDSRRKTTRKKKLDDIAKSDSEEESKENLEENTNNIEALPEEKQTMDTDSDDESSLKQLINKQKEQADFEEKEEVKPVSVDSPSPQIEETKSVVTPPETALKNTFRIPKKSGANENGMLAFRGPRICIRQSCEKPAVTSRERGGQYCGNECLVLFCREVFESWVMDREEEEKNKT